MDGMRRSAAVGVLLAFGWLGPSFQARASGTTKCQCDNGQIVYTLLDGDNACPDACSIHGGGGHFCTEEDDRCDYRGVAMKCADARRLRRQDHRDRQAPPPVTAHDPKEAGK